jgi:O-methyltransferase
VTASNQLQQSAPAETLRELYLELLERSLTHTLYAGSDAVGFRPGSPTRRRILELLRNKLGIIPVRISPQDEELRATGKDWPVFAQTMVGLERLRNIRFCIETVIDEGVGGDVIEAGVWRGGASIFARGVLKAHGVSDRSVWVADSFRGLPPVDAERYPADGRSHGQWHKVDYLKVSLETVKDNFQRYGLLDDQVKFLEGWFRDTLPTVREQKWAVVRLDGDMYESTMDGLTNLYPGLQPGGFLVIDDYDVWECRQAVEDFRRNEGITESIEKIDWTGVYWRRSR